jgi:hypothetical protein
MSPESYKSCRSCSAYVLRPCMIGMRPQEMRLSLEMGCLKNMPAVKWLGPCGLYQREPGADDL